MQFEFTIPTYLEFFEFYYQHYSSYSHHELTRLLNRYNSREVYLSEVEFDALYAVWEEPYYCLPDFDSLF